MAERTLSELEDTITEGAARIDAAMCTWLLDVAEFDRRAGYEPWECRSMAHFLSWRCGVSLRTARDHVRVAHAVERYPTLCAAFADGALSYSKVRAITRIVTPETESILVEWALCATAAHMDKITAKRRSVNEHEKPTRYVDWGNDDDGTFYFERASVARGRRARRGRPASARDALATSDKNGSAEPLSDSDVRPTNADALVRDGRNDAGARPDSGVGGRPPHGAVPRTPAKPASFSASTVAQRRALNVRDGGCRFPGCPQRLFVDAHHVDYWENGGPTDLDNLVLLCRVHHRAIHHRGYRIEKGPRQRFRFFRPDGLELIAAPAAAKASGEIPRTGPSGTPITPGDAPAELGRPPPRLRHRHRRPALARRERPQTRTNDNALSQPSRIARGIIALMPAETPLESGTAGRRVFTWRRWEIYAVLLAVVGAAVLFIGAPLWLNFKFDREAHRFGTPAGMRLTDSTEVEGDFFCVITCLGKSTELRFTTDMDRPDACAVLRRHLRAHGYTPEPPPIGAAVPQDSSCFYWARAGRIRKNATITAAVLASEPTTAVIRFNANNG